MIVNSQSFDIGDAIQFTSINPKDTRVWNGTVIGFCGYRVAAGYSDLINYYQQVLTGINGTNKISLLADAQFILLEIKTENGTMVQAISPEWILVESFKVIKAEASYMIQVYTHDGETVSNVLQLLRDNGFVCRSLS